MSAYGNPSIANVDDISPYKRWQVEINYAEQELKKFHDRARKTNRKFVDERDAINSDQKWFNLFHTNTKILRAALYAQIPVPDVRRKYLDYNDDIARVAAIVLQRCISPDGDDPRDTFDSVMRQVVFDRLVPGLATAWLRLETDTEEAQLPVNVDVPMDATLGFPTGPAPDDPQEATEAPEPAGLPEGQEPGETYTRITDQRVVLDYVHWEDFLWSPCRVWEERRWVARRVFMDRKELLKRFPKVGANVPLNMSPATLNDRAPMDVGPRHMAIQMAAVYEIWDRVERKVIWYCKDYPELLDVRDDFLHLVGFEPCPKPLLANVTTSNTVPRPDYYIVQDQYSELDTINNRVSMLVQACKVAGVYDKSAEGIQRLLIEGTDNVLIPVDNWAMFAEKGGVKGQVDWLPLEVVVGALQKLSESREVVKQQIYELTGIADIVRGASKASETLGAQQLKAQFASVRIKDLQDELAAFAAEILRIKAEILAKHFTPDLLIKKSNIMRTDDAQLAQPAVELIQSEEGFEWRIIVTADQLAQTDYAMQKQERTELLTAVGQYVSQIQGVLQSAPQLTPLFVNLLKWSVAGYRGAREIEGLLDRELDTMIKQQQQAAQQPPKPSPAELQAQSDMQLKQQEAQLDAQAKQQDMQFNAMSHAQDLKHQQQKQQLDIVGQFQKLQLDKMSKGQFQ